jgi:hypothetical protein
VDHDTGRATVTVMMGPTKKRFVVFASLIFAAFTLSLVAHAQDGEPTNASPVKSDLEEAVETRILQLEVTAWPKNGEAQQCNDLKASDFSVKVAGQPRTLVAVDRLGAYGTLDRSESNPDGSSTPYPMQYVIVLDQLHLDLWWRAKIRGLPVTCPKTSQVAFSWIREMIQNSYRPGDRLLFAMLSFEAKILTPWLETEEAVLKALEQIEVDPMLRMTGRIHKHNSSWFDSWERLLEALGHLPGRKDLYYLGDDWRPIWLEGTIARISRVSARAQNNHVLINPIDLLYPCRGDRIMGRIGMGSPDLLSQLATQSGGHLFEGGEDLDHSVSTMREIQECRFLLSVQAEEKDARKNGIRIRASIENDQFRLAAPERVEDIKKQATEEEKLRAVALYPSWERGLVTKALLWPLHPVPGEEKKKKKKKDLWSAFLLVRLQKAGVERWPTDVSEIVLQVVLHNGAKAFADFRTVLTGDDLSRFLQSKQGKLFSIRAEVPSGEVEVLVTARVPNTDLSTTSQTTHYVPSPPKPGEAHPWYFVDGVIDLGQGILSLRPAMEGVFSQDSSPLILGYGCPLTGSKRIEMPVVGRVVNDETQETRSVPIDWYDLSEIVTPDEQGCNFLRGQVPPSLTPGLWKYFPPTLGADSPGIPPLRFRVSDSF